MPCGGSQTCWVKEICGADSKTCVPNPDIDFVIPTAAPSISVAPTQLDDRTDKPTTTGEAPTDKPTTGEDLSCKSNMDCHKLADYCVCDTGCTVDKIGDGSGGCGIVNACGNKNDNCYEPLKCGTNNKQCIEDQDVVNLTAPPSVTAAPTETMSESTSSSSSGGDGLNGSIGASSYGQHAELCLREGLPIRSHVICLRQAGVWHTHIELVFYVTDSNACPLKVVFPCGNPIAQQQQLQQQPSSQAASTRLEAQSLGGFRSLWTSHV